MSSKNDGLFETAAEERKLSEIDQLVVHATHAQVHQRHMAINFIVGNLSVLCKHDIKKLFVVIDTLQKDQAISVRALLAEKLFEIGSYFSNHSKLGRYITSDLYDVIYKSLTDCNSQVRRACYDSVFNLLGINSIPHSLVEKTLVAVVLESTSIDNDDEQRADGVFFFIGLTPYMSHSVVAATVLPLFLQLSSDPSFHVRRACASCYADVCKLVGAEVSESLLLEKFSSLCEDNVWGVRKACVMSFPGVAITLSESCRSGHMTDLYLKLLADQSRWVRLMAYQMLGEFIATFRFDSCIATATSDESELRRDDKCNEQDAAVHEIEEVGSTASRETSSSASGDQGNAESMGDCRRNAKSGDVAKAGFHSDHHSARINLSFRSDSDGDETDRCARDRADGDSRAAGSVRQTSNRGKREGSGKEGDASEDENNIFVNNFSEFVSKMFGSVGDEVVLSVANEGAENLGAPNDVVECVESISSVTDSSSVENVTGVDTNLSSKVQVDLYDKASTCSNKFIAASSLETSGQLVGKVVQKSNCSTYNGGSFHAKSDENGLSHRLIHHHDHQLKHCTALDVNSIGDDDDDDDDAECGNAANTDTPSNIPAVESDRASATVTEDDSISDRSGNNKKTPIRSAPILLILDAGSIEESEAPVFETVLNFGTTHHRVRNKPSVINFGEDGKSGKDGDNDGGGDDKKGDGDSTEDEDELLMGESSRLETVNDFSQKNCLNLPEETVASRPLSPVTCRTLKAGGGRWCRQTMVYVTSKEGFGRMPPVGLTGKNKRSCDLKQSSVPVKLMDTYVDMSDTYLSELFDSDIQLHCAYSFPAVTLTLKKHNWHAIRDIYMNMATSSQVKVRRTLSHSIHEMASILGDEITMTDLLTVFDDFCCDVEEVRQGVIEHLYDFIKLLPMKERLKYIGKLPGMVADENGKNWRMRDVMIRELEKILDLLSLEQVYSHVVPFVFLLMSDQVSVIRQAAIKLIGKIIFVLSESATFENAEMTATDVACAREKERERQIIADDRPNDDEGGDRTPSHHHHHHQETARTDLESIDDTKPNSDHEVEVVPCSVVRDSATSETAVPIANAPDGGRGSHRNFNESLDVGNRRMELSKSDPESSSSSTSSLCSTTSSTSSSSTTAFLHQILDELVHKFASSSNFRQRQSFILVSHHLLNIPHFQNVEKIFTPNLLLGPLLLLHSDTIVNVRITLCRILYADFPKIASLEYIKRNPSELLNPIDKLWNDSDPDVHRLAERFLALVVH